MTTSAEKCKTAPTWLWPPDDGDPKLFWTQEGVDEAWEEGWHGPLAPPEEMTEVNLLSEAEWTKNELRQMINDDPRYEGFVVKNSERVADIRMRLLELEAENGIE